MTQVSKKILGVAILCSLVLGVIAGYATHSMLTPAAPTFRLPSEIPIGYIHASPVQVSLAKPAITMFTEDVNKFVQQAGIPVKFVVWEENAEESPTKARERAETLLARGVQVLVGPPWSSQVKAIMPLVNDRKIPLISCCATSTELAIPGDYVFRLSPDDSKQALLWARILADLKIKAALPIIIQEEYSVDIFASIQKAAPNIVYLKEIPVSAEKKEFVGELTEAEAEYKEALKQYSRDEIAILLFVTDGGAVYSPLLNDMAKFPELMKAKDRVLGLDVAGATGITQYAGGPASQVEFTAYSPAPAVASANYKDWKERFTATAGFEPEYHGYDSYDALWIAALSILSASEYTGEAIAKVIPTIAARYYGVSGWCVLNEAGDRMFPTFTIYRIIDSKWQLVGVYEGASDSITWQ